MIFCRAISLYMPEDTRIIDEYREAFRKYAKDGIIDMDHRLRRKFDFHIHRLETVVSELKGVVPPNRQSQYLITLVKKGSGQKTIGHFDFPIKRNTLMIVPKRVMHSSSYWSLQCAGYVISFSIDFFLQNAFPKHLIAGKKIFKISLRPFLTLSNDEAKKLSLIFEYIIAEDNGGENEKNEMIAVKILELLIECDRLFSAPQSPGVEEQFNHTIERFNELLEKNFSIERSVKFYADSLHVHPNHLNFLSKKLTDLTAKETINNRILLEAKYLLTSTSFSIKEIAYKLGFKNPEYFYSFFRKGVQTSPAAYRNKFI
jgi:AraC family transcriptional regulator, transcriptional activator of pobA